MQSMIFGEAVSFNEILDGLSKMYEEIKTIESPTNLNLKCRSH